MAITPGVRTLEHIDTVMKRLPAWRGPSRVRVLEPCKKRIMILHRAHRITAEQAAAYRAKVLPKLARAKERLQASERAKAAEDRKVWEYLQEWLRVARMGELRNMGAQLPRI